uniref:Thymosin beta n=1 Tax=Sciurus vulgaris TaxID=55149 RepID=A0A8D2DMZ3_SCIVU
MKWKLLEHVPLLLYLGSKDTDSLSDICRSKNEPMEKVESKTAKLEADKNKQSEKKANQREIEDFAI